MVAKDSTRIRLYILERLSFLKGVLYVSLDIVSATEASSQFWS